MTLAHAVPKIVTKAEDKDRYAGICMLSVMVVASSDMVDVISQPSLQHRRWRAGAARETAFILTRSMDKVRVSEQGRGIRGAKDGF